MESYLAPLWLEQAMELCEKVLREAAQRNPQNPVMSRMITALDTFNSDTTITM
ncbi:MAG: hypothetical protein JWQ87_5293 [Candidatus Sulfotelmatobacter sp.]|nr:hypothetical protein [Candidatus Sulfotelmatobacter sp.]